jgi:hypothetical protein
MGRVSSGSAREERALVGVNARGQVVRDDVQQPVVVRPQNAGRRPSLHGAPQHIATHASNQGADNAVLVACINRRCIEKLWACVVHRGGRSAANWGSLREDPMEVGACGGS